MASARHLLVGIDNTKASQDALLWAANHLYRPGDLVHLIHVLPEPDTLHFRPGLFTPPGEEDYNAEAKEAEEMVRAAFAPILQDRRIPSDLHLIAAPDNPDSIADVLLEKARELQAAPPPQPPPTVAHSKATHSGPSGGGGGGGGGSSADDAVGAAVPSALAATTGGGAAAAPALRSGLVPGPPPLGGRDSGGDGGGGNSAVVVIIVAGHSKQRLQEFWTGSVCRRLLRRSPVPVIVHRSAAS